MRFTRTTGVVVLAFGFVLALGAASAQAGELVQTIHKLQIKGKALAEGDGKVEKAGFNSKDIQEICCGELDKDNDLFVTFFDACDDNGGLNSNSIRVLDKKTGAFIKNIGDIGFGFLLSEETKDGGLKSQHGLGSINIDCGNGSGIQIDIDGSLWVEFDKDECVERVKFVNGLGVGNVDGDTVIAEQVKGKSGKDQSDKFTQEP